MGVGHRPFRVAAVAHPADELTGLHGRSWHDAASEAPRPAVGAVVGAWGVVVHVVHVVLVSVAVADDHAVAGGGVVDQMVDHPVVHGEDRLQPVTDDVVALVCPPASIAAGAEVVAVPDRAGDRERDGRSSPESTVPDGTTTRPPGASSGGSIGSVSGSSSGLGGGVGEVCAVVGCVGVWVVVVEATVVSVGGVVVVVVVAGLVGALVDGVVAGAGGPVGGRRLDWNRCRGRRRRRGHGHRGRCAVVVVVGAHSSSPGTLVVLVVELQSSSTGGAAAEASPRPKRRQRDHDPDGEQALHGLTAGGPVGAATSTDTASMPGARASLPVTCRASVAPVMPGAR